MRLSYNGDRCTVRYRGKLPIWTETALGVEWDDPHRGKHSGEFQGKKYFACTVDGAGSFLKESKQHDAQFSFQDALVSKYTVKHGFTEIALSSAKAIESVGMDDHFERHRSVDALRVISLSECCITNFGTGTGVSGAETAAAETAYPELPSLRELDLSGNLFEDWDECISFLARYKLEKLHLRGNRFTGFVSAAILPTVHELNLGDTLIPHSELAQILKSFPNLKRLGLSKNRYTQVPPCVLVDALAWVDLAYNFISTFPSQGRHLILSNNKIESISQETFYDYLDLMDQNTITQLKWSDIDKLTVKDLWLSEAVHSRPIVIGRLGSVEKLNGTPVTQEERKDNELFLLSRINCKEQPPLPQARRAQLAQLYGESRTNPASNSISARLVTFDVNGNQIRIVKTAPMRRLITLASRKLERRADTFALKYDGVQFDGEEIIEDILKGGEVLEVVDQSGACI